MARPGRPLRVFITFGCLVTALGLSGGPPGAHEQRAAAQSVGRPPNIVLILTDDLDNAQMVNAPHITDLIGSQGVNFTSYFDTVSLCCPSRTSILRGQYTHNHQITS